MLSDAQHVTFPVSFVQNIYRMFTFFTSLILYLIMLILDFPMNFTENNLKAHITTEEKTEEKTCDGK